MRTVTMTDPQFDRVLSEINDFRDRLMMSEPWRAKDLEVSVREAFSTGGSVALNMFVPANNAEQDNYWMYAGIVNMYGKIQGMDDQEEVA